jgi:hypothetical protein
LPSEIISEQRATSNRNAGRDHPGIAGDFSRNHQKERQQVEVSDPLASLSPEQRLAQVVEIMAKARALLAATPDDVTDAEYEEVDEA